MLARAFSGLAADRKLDKHLQTKFIELDEAAVSGALGGKYVRSDSYRRQTISRRTG